MTIKTVGVGVYCSNVGSAAETGKHCSGVLDDKETPH